MLWKIYFWVNFILSLIGTVLILQMSPLALIDVISLLWSAVGLIATYSYAYHKRVCKPIYWRIVIWFVFFLTFESLFEVFILPPGFIEKTFPILKSNIHSSVEGGIFGLIFMLPTVYATYKLSLAKH